MCLIVFNWDPSDAVPLVLAANRDEFYDRPTLPIGYWEDAPHIVGGRDLKAGGTWLATSTDGRWAALTNHRNLRIPEKENARSRGELVSNFLQGHDAPSAYVASVHERKHLYNGFNLLVGNAKELWYISNRGEWWGQLRPGLYGLSNALLNTPWPKLELAKQQLVGLLGRTVADMPLAIFQMMHNEEKPADSELPDTGIGLEWERILGSMHISSPKYGTRCTTALIMPSRHEIMLFERSHGPEHWGDRGFAFKIA